MGMTESALSGRNHRLLVALTGLSGAGIAVALFERSRLSPVPQRFPEAANAFLYSIGFLGVLTGVLAAVSIGLGFHVRAIWRRREAKALKKGHADTPLRPDLEDSRWDMLRANFSFAAGIALTLVAVPLIWRDAESYVALTEAGYVGRSYLSGAITSVPWSSLHHVEFECARSSRLRRSRDVLPRLSFRFVGGRSVGDVLSMRPYGSPKMDAVAHLEALRAENHVPLIWKSSRQEEKFYDHDAEIGECVDNLLSQFPAEKREALMAMLTGRARLRVETIVLNQ
jgi:hypothetical protein